MSVESDLGAFRSHLTVAGAAGGPLAGLTFAVKDVFDVAGDRTGAGNPDWLRTHEPATMTAPAVQVLLDAGATMVGKTHTDELTYSLNGENFHYGTPVNPRAPDRVPGGSSSGSVVAVAGGLADFALGTDCGGSVRLPSSYCGVWGLRPTHGRIPLDGVVPLASSFDTVGWFARDAAMLERVGRVYFPDDGVTMPRRLLVADDGFELAGDAVTGALQPALDRVMASVDSVEHVTVSAEGLLEWSRLFRELQAAEIWAAHGEWIRETRPRFDPDIRARFEWAATIDPLVQGPLREKRERIAAQLDDLLDGEGVLCLPTTPGIAPLKNTPPSELEAYRARSMGLLCTAGLARLPQISMPLAELDGCPLGLSLVGARGAEAQVLAIAGAGDDART